eukprot:scaffold861_cov231-Chaetoceros_neogracile.AAC.13
MVPTTDDGGHVQVVSDLHNLFPKYNHIIPCHDDFKKKGLIRFMISALFAVCSARRSQKRRRGMNDWLMIDDRKTWMEQRKGQRKGHLWNFAIHVGFENVKRRE